MCIFITGSCVQAGWEEFSQNFHPIRSVSFIQTYFQRKCRGRKEVGFYPQTSSQGSQGLEWIAAETLHYNFRTCAGSCTQSKELHR